MLAYKSDREITFNSMILRINNVATSTVLPSKLHSHPFSTECTSIYESSLDRINWVFFIIRWVNVDGCCTNCSHEKMNASVYRCIMYKKYICMKPGQIRNGKITLQEVQNIWFSWTPGSLHYIFAFLVTFLVKLWSSHYGSDCSP